MVNYTINNEKKNKRIGLLISLLVHLLILIFVLFSPPLQRELPPPGYEGIMVRFGDVNESSEQKEEKDPAESSAEKKTENNKSAEQPTTKNNISNPNIKETAPSEKEKITVKTQPAKKNEPDLASNQKSAKESYSKFFKSKGNKSSSGSQGDPLGSKDSDILEGITRGKGKVGDGLDARGIMNEPSFEDSSQKSGTVVVRLCINNEGKVISARYTQKGSTTTDSELINIAVSNSKKYRFSPSVLPEQCGTVSITFIVR
ncbi:MAG: hypothetical protein ACM3PT_01725 [Deltaproteobacteria bacterium]